MYLNGQTYAFESGNGQLIPTTPARLPASPGHRPPRPWGLGLAEKTGLISSHPEKT
jgi:hypothetical protein